MRTITVPIGPNMSIDGGPFENFRADGIDGETDPESGKLVDVESGLDADIETVEDAVRTDVLDAQPLHLSTGDVGSVGGEPIIVGEIEVPLKAGYFVNVHNGKPEPERNLGNLTERDVETIERKINRYGGEIQG